MPIAKVSCVCESPRSRPLSGQHTEIFDKAELARILWFTRAGAWLFHYDGLVQISIHVSVVDVHTLYLQLLCLNFRQEHSYGVMPDHRGAQVVLVEVTEGQL